MRLAVFGAGATGGHVAVRLAAAGHEVTAIARGPHLAAIREHGLTLESGAERVTVRLSATDRPEEAGPQDAVLVMVKATGLAAAATALGPLVGPRTLLAFPQNGIPWWYPVALPPGLPRPPDLPGFALADRFLALAGPERTLGGVIQSANEVVAPGVVRNGSPGVNRLILKALSGDAADALRAVLDGAGIEAPPPPDLRAAVWRKLLVNMSASGLALVTGQPSSVVRDDPDIGALFLRLVAEGLAIARAHGIDLTGSVDPEAVRAGLAPGHVPSLLQDFRAGRAMEVAEILLAPRAFARAAGIAAPVLETVAAIGVRLARDRGLFSA